MNNLNFLTIITFYNLLYVKMFSIIMRFRNKPNYIYAIIRQPDLQRILIHKKVTNPSITLIPLFHIAIATLASTINY